MTERRAVSSFGLTRMPCFQPGRVRHICMLANSVALKSLHLCSPWRHGLLLTVVRTVPSSLCVCGLLSLFFSFALSSFSTVLLSLLTGSDFDSQPWLLLGVGAVCCRAGRTSASSSRKWSGGRSLMVVALRLMLTHFLTFVTLSVSLFSLSLSLS